MINESLKNLATPIDDLHTLPGNPRRGDIAAVARSLERFGQRKPIVAKHSDGTIIAGNHTWQAAKQLGWNEIAVVWTDDDDNTAHAFALADNRTAELGTYDEDALREMIAQLVNVDPELVSDAGYSQEAIAEILKIPVEEIPMAGDLDAAPAKPRTAHSIEGDTWILGPHRLVVGDSTNPEILRKTLNGKLADCIFTDPPYNVAYAGGTNENLTIQNDSMSDLEFESFLLATFGAMYANAKDGCPIYVCHADRTMVTFLSSFKTSGFMMKQILIWVKDNFILSRQDYNWRHEPIIYGWKPGAAHPWFGPFNDSTVLDFETKDLNTMSKTELVNIIETARESSTIIREPRPRRNSEHPTMKPINLITRILSNSANRESVVLDPFAGSGSTLVAAHSLGMTAALVELDPIYADVICKRWQELTGILPVNELTGKPYDFIGSDNA
jgi:DNA modification methylase